ncbi:hypothetical protein RND81_10G193100 [Saponaria officinalis]|uniref:tRNA (guanine(26)-N(2))-dimethyltransferase n=1 Tax=Saponaria officinalis TaxID=3572 RepID=A0AAW1I6I2_SAPOF
MPSIAMVGLPSQKHYLHGTWKCLLAEITVAKFPNRILVYGVEGGSPVFFETLMDVVPKYTRQVNNRDISIAVLRTFIKKRKEDHEAFVSRNAKGGPKTSEKKSPASGSEEAPAKSEVNNVNGIHDGNSAEPLADEACGATPEEPKNTTKVKDQRELKPIRVLEALSASGLRALRYTREVEGVDKVVALDNDEASVEACGRNIKYNGSVASKKVESNLADARVYMLTHPNEFDVVDLDPYGSPSVFLDSAVQSVADGGMLMCTAMDMAVLCGGNAEVVYAKYVIYILQCLGRNHCC